MQINLFQDQVNILKTEGYQFPALKESDAMFSADTAPEWAEGECCHRCRVQFTMMQRKVSKILLVMILNFTPNYLQHHCRACGQVFCQQCSSKTSTLPKFGIEKEVRVCEACFDKFNKSVFCLFLLETAYELNLITGPNLSARPGKMNFHLNIWLALWLSSLRYEATRHSICGLD